VLGEGRTFNTRNAPDVFNRGFPDFKAINWDGSISLGEDKLEETPAGKDIPPSLDGPLAAQQLFALASRQTMRGQVDDSAAVDKTPNELASIPDDDLRQYGKHIWLD
jgi:hypothetical protein